MLLWWVFITKCFRGKSKKHQNKYSLANLQKKNLKSIIYESQIQLHFMHITSNWFCHLECALYSFPFMSNIDNFRNLRNSNKVISLRATCPYTSATVEYSDSRWAAKASLSTEPDILTLDSIYYGKSNTLPMCHVTSGKYTGLNWETAWKDLIRMRKMCSVLKNNKYVKAVKR